MTEIPMGLVGVHPRQPIGVHINMSIRGDNGAPTFGGRFWLMAQPTLSRKYSSGQKSWTALARDEHPRFIAWNTEARKLGSELDPKRGAGRVGMLRGNIVHARWNDAAGWNRSAQKLPAPHPNPSLSRRPACEGNGIRARRFVRNHGDEEVFQSIACPNQLCPFAQAGVCKPDTNLVFKLRWNEGDPWELQFPALLAHWHTGGWESTAALMGLFEYVLGSEALLSPEDRAQATDEERSTWRPGFASALGLRSEDVSLVGMPFSMSVHYRTKAGDSRNPSGSRFPVVSFSPEGDLEAWLVAQHQRRTLLAGVAPETLALPPASVADPGFVEITRHEARLEATGAVLDEVIDVEAVVDPIPALLAEIKAAAVALHPGEPESRVAATLRSVFDVAKPADMRTLSEAQLNEGLVTLCGLRSARAEAEAEPTAGVLERHEIAEPFGRGEPQPLMLSPERRARLIELAELKFGPEGKRVLLDFVEKTAGTRDLAQCPAIHDTSILRFMKDEEVRRLREAK